jgi:hypothetical protein
MATEALSYVAAETAFSVASNLNSLANNAGKPLGSVDNTTVLATNYKYKVKCTLPAASVVATGTIEVWLIGSITNATTDWTDNLSPSGTSDIAASLKCAKLLDVVPANAVNQVVVIQGEIIGPQLTDVPLYWSLVVVNKCGAALGASGHAATFVATKYTVN